MHARHEIRDKVYTLISGVTVNVYRHRNKAADSLPFINIVTADEEKQSAKSMSESTSVRFSLNVSVEVVTGNSDNSANENDDLCAQVQAALANGLTGVQLFEYRQSSLDVDGEGETDLIMRSLEYEAIYCVDETNPVLA